MTQETKTVLVIEHSAQMRRLIRTLVSGKVHEVVECNASREALSAYANHLPDWVLIGINTSGAEGIEATRRIKELFPEASIIVLVDYDEPALREAAFRAGASGYVLKDDLLSLQTILGERT